jgi:PAS domain S-box-containing protein
MTWQWTPYTILLIVAAVTSVTSALYVWRRRPVPGSRTLVLIALAGAEWLVTYVLELRSVDPLTKDLWNKIQYVGIVVVPTAWLVFTLQYTNREKWLTRRNLVLLSIVPGLTLLTVFTNETHGLFWERDLFDVDGSLSVVSRPHGTGFWIHIAYTYTLLLAVILLLAQMLIRSRHLYRRQASLLLFSALLPLLGNVLVLSGLNPFPYFDWTPLLFTAANLILTWSFFYLRVGDIVPVACRVIIESMSDGVIVLDEQNRIVDLNSVAQHIVGHTAAEAIGQPVKQVWPHWPDLVEYTDDKVEIKVIPGQENVQNIYDVRISPIVDWRGRLASQVVVLRDVTEHKRVEEALQQRNRELTLFNRAAQAFISILELDQVLDTVLEEVRSLLNVTACSIWLSDPATGELVCQQATGPRSEIVRDWRLGMEAGIAGWVTRHGESLIVPDTRLDERYYKSVDQQTGLSLRSILCVPLRAKKQVIGVLEVVDTEVNRFTSTDLALVEPLAASAAIAIENARLYEAVRQELTERKQAEAAQRESEKRYHTLFERVPVGLHRSTPDGDPLEANPAMLQMMGFPDWQALAKVNTVDSYVHPQDYQRLRALMEQEGAVRNFEVQLRRADGALIWVKIDALAIQDADGQILYYEGSMEDITERKQMEEQLRRQERLAAVGQLAGGIAHDFNNLMATIILCAQIGLRKMDDLPSDVAQAFETIFDESQRAAKLVQQILDFSRRSMMETHPLDLVSFIKEVIGILQRTIPESIHLTFDARDTGEEHTAPLTVKADPTRIQQVLMNLALNARDAMPQGGKLHIELERIEVSPDELPPWAKREEEIAHRESQITNQTWICLTVSDTGTGMTEEAQAHLFEPFFTTKEPGAGTGLGLAQVYGIVKQHKGHIGVETAVGKGTTFRVYLPTYEGEEMQRAETEEDSTLPRGKNETILLVEDETRLREAIGKVLELLGYQVLTAANGKDALETYWSTEKIDLVIADLVMPVMGGEQLLRVLREENPDLKALTITGYVIEADLEALKQAGFLGVVHKPFDTDHLAKVVRRALDTNREEHVLIQ